jgi:dTDP-4-dehydrorhamnose 3,5-epimerase
MPINSVVHRKILLLTPPRFGDHRGYFGETYSRRRYAEMEIDFEFVQDNHSLSRAVGTLRGLHFQAPPHGQGKLVRCGRGAIFDVAVDIRLGSPTYGQWKGYELTAETSCLCQWVLPMGSLHYNPTAKSYTNAQITTSLKPRVRCTGTVAGLTGRCPLPRS